MLYNDWLMDNKIGYFRNRQWIRVVLQPFLLWYFGLEYGHSFALYSFYRDVRLTARAYRRYRGGC